MGLFKLTTNYSTKILQLVDGDIEAGFQMFQKRKIKKYSVASQLASVQNEQTVS